MGWYCTSCALFRLERARITVIFSILASNGISLDCQLSITDIYLQIMMSMFHRLKREQNLYLPPDLQRVVRDGNHRIGTSIINLSAINLLLQRQHSK